MRQLHHNEPVSPARGLAVEDGAHLMVFVTGISF